jgi:hypothetical protein
MNRDNRSEDSEMERQLSELNRVNMWCSIATGYERNAEGRY